MRSRKKEYIDEVATFLAKLLRDQSSRTEMVLEIASRSGVAEYRVLVVPRYFRVGGLRKLFYVSKRTVQGSPESTLNSFFVPQIGGAYRYHVSDQFFLEPRVLLWLPFSESSSSGSDTLTADHPSVLHFDGTVGFSPVPDFLAYLTFSFEKYSADGTIQSGTSIARGSFDVSRFDVLLGVQREF